MAFRATNIIPAAGLRDAKAAALRVRSLAQMFATKFQAATVRRDEVIQCWQEFAGFSDALTALRNVPGIGPYATAQENDEGYDVAAAFGALIDAVDAVVANIESTFPKDASGFLAVVKFGAGQLEQGTFTAAQLATLRSLLTAAAAEVE